MSRNTSSFRPSVRTTAPTLMNPAERPGVGRDMLTIDGIPLHPLLVHAVVVLLPLAALGSIAIALVPRWRQRYAWPVLGVTLAGVAAVPVAKQAGEDFQAALAKNGVQNPAIQTHADLGTMLLPIALGFGVAVIALLVAG